MDPVTQLRIGTDAELRSFPARSHLSDGRVVAWTGEQGEVAIDAEIRRPVPPHLARRHGPELFWERWTRLECIAKLTDTPVVMLQAGGLPADPDRIGGPGLDVHTGELVPEPGTVVVVSIAQRVSASA